MESSYDFGTTDNDIEDGSMEGNLEWRRIFINNIKERDLLQRDEFSSVENLNIIAESEEHDRKLNIQNLLSLDLLKYQYRIVVFFFFTIVLISVSIVLSVVLTGSSRYSTRCNNVNISSLSDVGQYYGCQRISTLYIKSFDGFLELPFVNQIETLGIWNAGNVDNTNVSLPSLNKLGSLTVENFGDFNRSKKLLDFRLPKLETIVEMAFIRFTPNTTLLSLESLQEALYIQFYYVGTGSINFDELVSVAGAISFANCNISSLNFPSLVNTPLIVLHHITSFTTVFQLVFPVLTTVETLDMEGLNGVHSISMPNIQNLTYLKLANFYCTYNPHLVLDLIGSSTILIEGFSSCTHVLFPKLIVAEQLTVQNSLSMVNLSMPLLTEVIEMKIMRNLDLESFHSPNLTKAKTVSLNSNVALTDITLELLSFGEFIMTDCSAVTKISLPVWSGPSLVLTTSSGLVTVEFPSLVNVQLLLIDGMASLTTLSIPKMQIFGKSFGFLSSTTIWYIARYNSALLSLPFAGLVLNNNGALAIFSIAASVNISTDAEFYVTNNRNLESVLMPSLSQCQSFIFGSNRKVVTLSIENLQVVQSTDGGSAVANHGTLYINETLLSNLTNTIPNFVNAGSLQIESTRLKSIELNKLRYLNYSFVISENAILTNLLTPSLTYVKNLVISNNSALCLNGYSDSITKDTCIIGGNANLTCDTANGCSATPLNKGLSIST